MNIDRRFIVLALGAVLLSTCVGGLLGQWSVPKYVPSELFIETQLPEESGQSIQERHDTRVHVSVAPGSHFPSVLQELHLALESEVYSFVLATPLPVSEMEHGDLIETLKRVTAMDEDIRVTLSLNCNPPASWLREHPEASSSVKQEGFSYPSVTSQAWALWAKSRLEALMKTLSPFVAEGSVDGLVLEALENGHWTRQDGYDQSPVHTQAFQEWLLNRYETIEGLHAAWHDEGIVEWSAVTVPVPVESPGELLYRPADEMNMVDYHRFLNDSTVGTINTLSRAVKALAPPSFTVEIPYGNVLEYGGAASGNWGGGLDFTVIDGLMTFPLSREKALGHHAFFATPPYAGRNFGLLDSVYTGIGYEKSSNRIEVPGTYQPKQIESLMARNAALVSLYPMTWAWSDPKGQGTLVHPPLWSYLRDTLALRSTLRTLSAQRPVSPNIVVVMDEASMAYVREGDVIQSLFTSLLNSISHSGIEVQWTTLDKFVSGDDALTAPVYLFPNLFQVSDERREAIHAKLALLAKQALESESDTKEVSAIWLYAPGVLRENVDAEFVTALTGIKTEVREAGTVAGSRFTFSGSWIEEDQAFGDERALSLLLQSVDDQVDPLARYRDDDSVSAAMKYLESGWISIVHFEPTLTPEFLRDILAVLEVPVRLPEVHVDGPVVAYTNRQFSLLHAPDDLTIQLDFDEPYDVDNLLNAEQGWNHARSVELSLSAGETAVLAYK